MSRHSLLDSERIDLLDRLEEGDGEDTGGKAEELAADDGRRGGTSVWLHRGRRGGNRGVAAGRHLRLSFIPVSK